MHFKREVFLKNAAVYILLVCASLLLIPQAQASAPSVTPEQIVLELLEAMDANDAGKIRSLFSADATQEYERWWARKKEGEDFRKWLESDIISAHGRVSSPEIRVDGKQVIVTGTYVNSDSYSSPADFLLLVEHDKITSWTMGYD